MNAAYAVFEAWERLGEDLRCAYKIRQDAIGPMCIALYQDAEDDLFSAATNQDFLFALANAENARAFITSYIHGVSPLS